MQKNYEKLIKKFNNTVSKFRNDTISGRYSNILSEEEIKGVITKSPIEIKKYYPSYFYDVVELVVNGKKNYELALDNLNKLISELEKELRKRGRLTTFNDGDWNFINKQDRDNCFEYLLHNIKKVNVSLNEKYCNYVHSLFPDLVLLGNNVHIYKNEKNDNGNLNKYTFSVSFSFDNLDLMPETLKKKLDSNNNINSVSLAIKLVTDYNFKLI